MRQRSRGPARNLTGFSNFEAPIGGKWLEMLIEIAPTTKRIGFVYHPAASPHRQFLKAAEASSPSLGLGLTAIPVTAVTEIETLITAFAKAGSDSAIAVAPHALPLGSRQPDYAACGRPPLAGNLRRPAFHAQRRADVLRHQHAQPAAPRRGVCGSHPEGAKPAQLPIQLPTRYDMVIDTKTAKALGLTVPPSLLARADELIE